MKKHPWPRWFRRAFLATVILTVPLHAAVDVLSGGAETRSYWRACRNRWVFLAEFAKDQP